MSNAQTTVELKGKEFPFYRTNRGQFDFENAGYTTNDIANGKVSAMLAYIFFSARACAKRAQMNWPYSSLGQFVDDTDTDILSVFTRLRDAEEAQAQPEGDNTGDENEDSGNPEPVH